MSICSRDLQIGSTECRYWWILLSKWNIYNMLLPISYSKYNKVNFFGFLEWCLRFLTCLHLWGKCHQLYLSSSTLSPMIDLYFIAANDNAHNWMQVIPGRDVKYNLKSKFVTSSNTVFHIFPILTKNIRVLLYRIIYLFLFLKRAVYFDLFSKP